MDDLELLLPELLLNTPDLSTAQLRLQGTLQQRLPSIPGHGVESFFMSNRAEEAAAMAEAIGIAFEEDRQRAIIMRAKSRAEDRIAQRYAEGRY
jgi:hypothetical protein